jgi:16S rRNA processing protein RimM
VPPGRAGRPEAASSVAPVSSGYDRDTASFPRNAHRTRTTKRHSVRGSERESWISIGRVGKPHGLDGAFVVERASEAPERFAPGARVYVARQPASVVEQKRAGGRLVIRLDRRPPRGADLELPLAELPEPGEGAYYAFQLAGLAVEEDGRALGRVEEVEAGVANDVLRLDSGIRLPLVEECVRQIDLDEGRILVAPGFSDPG